MSEAHRLQGVIMIDGGGHRYRAALILAIFFGLLEAASAVEPNEVIVWEHSGFHGDSYSWSQEQGMRHRLVDHFPGWLNDEISSIEVGSDVKVITYRHSDFAGPSKTYEGQVNSLSDYWNDEISSLIIFPKNQADPLGAVLSDTAFHTVTSYEPAHQFFPLPEDLEIKSVLYTKLDNYINDEAEYVLLQGDNVEVTLYRHAYDNKFSDTLTLPSSSCSSDAAGNWKGYRTFRLSGCALNLEEEVSSLEVKEIGPAEVQSYGTPASSEPTPHRAPPAREEIDGPKLMQTPDLSFLAQPLSSEDSSSTREAISKLSGRVYVGDMGVENSPLAGASLELYCSNDPFSLGRRVDSTSTNSGGWYELTVPSGCEFYSIRMTPPSGYRSEVASSVGGRVLDSNTIQYEYPLKDRVLTGNKFWVESSTQVAPSRPIEPGQPLEPAPEGPTCPEGCECMPEEMAEQEFGRYERCSPQICGYDQDINPLYCFRPLEMIPARLI